MKTLFFCGIVAAAATASNVSASIQVGDTLSLSRVGTSPSRAIQYSYDSSRTWNQGTGGATGSFGIAGLTTFDVASGGQLEAFCVEINEGFPDDPISYNVVGVTNVPEETPPGPMSAFQSTVMQDLYARYYNDVSTAGGGGETWSDASDEAAAFQLVIWEISHEEMTGVASASDVVSRLDITLGAMAFTDTYNSNVATIANAMIASLGSGGFLSQFNLLGLTNPTNQDMLIVVPTPAIAGLAGLGLVGMRRRRR